MEWSGGLKYTLPLPFRKYFVGKMAFYRKYVQRISTVFDYQAEKTERKLN